MMPIIAQKYVPCREVIPLPDVDELTIGEMAARLTLTREFLPG